MARPGKDKSKSEDKKKRKKKGNELRFFTVTEEKDGALVCDCPDYEATGKPCAEILAARLYIEFGPAQPYLAEPEGSDTHGPKAKGKKAKHPRKTKGGSDGRRKQRPVFDHTVDEDIDDFLDHEEKGWQAFGSDDESDQFSDVEGPSPKKSKPDAPGTQGQYQPAFIYSPPLLSIPAEALPLRPSSVTPKKSPMKPAHSAEPPEFQPEILTVAPPKNNKAEKKKVNFVQGLGLTPEDLDILDIEWNRWQSSEYTLRMDEVDEAGSLLEALSLGLSRGILVLGPSYASEAKHLRQVDWMPSDDEPIDATGAPAFVGGSVLHKAWQHSQKITLKFLLFLHYDSDRAHWLLFSANLSTEEISCYEPLADHGEGVDVEDIILLTKFFKPQRQAQMPTIPPGDGYTLHLMDVQRDSSACGFWMITVAFLFICDVPITKQSLGTLRLLGSENIKRHWKYLLTSWRIEEKGLEFQPVNDFLDYWGHGYQQKKTRIIARRPEWIPRFNPHQALDLLREANKMSGESEQERLPEAKDAAAAVHEQAEDLGPHEMPSHEELKIALNQLHQMIPAYEREQKTLKFLRESLNADDLKRFINFEGGKANDEIINMFVAVFSWTPHSDTISRSHYGDIFGLTLPPRDFKIMTTFFYIKLQELRAAQHPETGDPENAAKIHAKLVRWFKNDNLKEVRRIFIPTNEPAQTHWFLTVLNLDEKAILFYDSLPPKETSTRIHYKKPAKIARLALEVISAASGSSPFSTSGWKLINAEIPIQNNAIDCGFYMLMALMHLVYLRKVHDKKCPPNLHFSSETMQKNRTILATSIFTWIWQYDNEILPVDSKAGSPVGSSVAGEEDLEAPVKPRNPDSPVPSSVDGEEDELSGPPQKNSPADVLGAAKLVPEASEVVAGTIESETQEIDSIWGSPLTSLPSSFVGQPLPTKQLRRAPRRAGRPAQYTE
ncbi:hypothetical protein C8R43DRAFT_1187889 [Mycena crocata]|nr:hypothetical protein C8R43DRAFT_1187889 [Mycena crocata]